MLSSPCSPSVAALNFFFRIFRPFGLMYLAVGALLRCILWIVFREDSDLTLRALAVALGLGAVNDLLQLVYLLLPFTILLTILPIRFISSVVGRSVIALVSYAALFGVLFLSVAEFLFWEEFEARFNLIAVDYLAYPTEVVGNIHESYPVIPLVLGMMALAALLWVPLWRGMQEFLRSVPAFFQRLKCAITHAGLVTAGLLLFSTNSLSFSSDRAQNELSMNGIGTFFRAALTDEIDYHQFYRTLPSTDAFAKVREYYQSLGEVYASPDATSLVRSHPAKAGGLGKLNVVILGEESFGARFVGAYGDTRGLTPNFDALSKQGLMFANAYATGTRTVRGLEAMSASFPPIPSESIVKRPGSDNISTWGAIMRQNGYHTSFLYGGQGTFDNMNSFFGGNGYALSDRLDISNPKFGNIWGVSDEDLFMHAIAYFDRLHSSNTGPFYSLVMSTSNHKPFTFPEGLPGIPAKGGGREAGIKYADYAIGRFFEEAKKHPWYDNTIFVVIADHDSRVYGKAHVPVRHYRIPALIIAPKHIKPEVSQKIFSNMDLAPTILGLLGISYEAPFYGVDVLDDRIPADRPVMFSHNHDIALYQNGVMTVLGLQQEARTFSYDDEKTAPLPLDEERADLLAAFLQSAYELFQGKRY
jgi:phosphoglycerol transferase MdoB-like AlkP superfamily enzyme